MENHLTAYVEFLGLPGSGKSYFSHKVAEMLRAEGYRIKEPSWELDHTTGRYIRAIKKMIMAWLFAMCHHRKAAGIKAVVNGLGLTKGDAKRFLRNILYKAYLVRKRKEDVLFFDEGIAQVTVSMAVCANKTAGEIYKDIISVLTIGNDSVLIRIDCGIETALLNMDIRASHDSYVEKLSGLEGKKAYLNRYQAECESVDTINLVAIPFCFDTEKIVTEISNIIKSQI